MAIRKVQLPDNTIVDVNDNRIVTSSPTDGQALVFNSTNQKWENRDIPYIGEFYAEKTYSQLKTMVDGGTLVKGQMYHITDYVTTTAQTDTSVPLTPNQFDLVVTAISNSELDHRASALLHSGDTYFTNAGADLSKWQIWYDINNDTTKYSWADTTNGKGVIYRMIDEWGNDCPYDFKNILFTISGKIANAYTFNVYSDSVCSDHSLNGPYCYANTMEPYFDNSIQQRLNFNVFYNVSTTAHCFLNTFGNICHNNTFGDECFLNTFKNDCHNNIFGDGCYDNTFGNYSSYNTFGNDCWYNISDTISYSILGNQCVLNRFNSSFYILFGNNCEANILEGYNLYIYFGNYCKNNKIGLNSSGIIFGNSIESPHLYGDYVQNVVVESGNAGILLYNSGTADSSNYLQNIYLAHGLYTEELINNNNTYLEISSISRGLKYRTTVAALSTDATGLNPRIYKEDEDDRNVQADWNQTDTTANDHIKNKPEIYSKPSTGIPESDLSLPVRQSLDNWLAKKTAPGDTTININVDNYKGHIHLFVDNADNASAVSINVEGSPSVIFGEQDNMSVDGNSYAVIDMKIMDTGDYLTKQLVASKTIVSPSYTNKTFTDTELGDESVAIVLLDNQTDSLVFIPYKYFDYSSLDTVKYTVKPFIRFHRGKNGRTVLMHARANPSEMWASYNKYRINIDTTSPGSFSWSITISGTVRSGNVSWDADDTLDSIVEQMTNYTRLTFSHVEGENFIRVVSGGYSNSTFTITNAIGATVEDLSVYVKINGVQQAQVHRTWQAQNVHSMFPGIGFLANTTVQYSVSGYNLSYRCGGNETKYKSYYTTNGTSEYLAENAVSSRMKPSAFAALNGSAVAEQQALYNKYNGSWDAYMDASMAKLDDSHSDGIEYLSYDNGDGQTAILASVTTMDFDGSYICPFLTADMCYQIQDVNIYGGHCHLSTQHEIGVFMRDEKLAEINAAMDVLAATGVPVNKLSNSSYYWSVARYHDNRAWLYYGTTGTLTNYRLYGSSASRPLAYL